MAKPMVIFLERIDEVSVKTPGTFTLKNGTKTIGVTVAYVETRRASRR